jgi:hypothetical protein
LDFEIKVKEMKIVTACLFFRGGAFINLYAILNDFLLSCEIFFKFFLWNEIEKGENCGIIIKN